MTTSNPPDLDALPALPRDENGPLFAEPWQAQAFALAVTLQEQGHFTWTEWCAALNREIEAARAAGDPDLGDTYYRHWLAALESLVIAKGLSCGAELAERAAAWDRAHRATPHGEPVVLDEAARRGA
jgi:nitrile hydratase accessory protein